MFKFYQEAFKGFSQHLRDGLSPKVLEFLSNPTAYELEKLKPEKEVSENHTNIDLSANNSSETEQLPVRASITCPPTCTHFFLQVRTKEVPLHLQGAIQLDGLVKIMPMDVECLFNAFSEYILAGVDITINHNHKRGRGRPKGSKNKQKDEPPQKT